MTERSNSLDISVRGNRQKIIFIGDVNVGKTTIINRIQGNDFEERYDATIGIDFCLKIIKHNNNEIKLQMWDTAGQEKYKAITRNYYKDAHGIILIYDVTNKSSFKNLPAWLNDINNNNNLGEDISIILVGNKTDLPFREVSSEEGDGFAKNNNLLFVETSSKEGHNVENVFEMVTKDILANNENIENYNDMSMSLNESVKSVRDARQNESDSKAMCC